MSRSVTGVKLRETGVRGTSGSRVGRASTLMPPGLLRGGAGEAGLNTDGVSLPVQTPCSAQQVVGLVGGDFGIHLILYQFIYYLSGEREKPVTKLRALLASFRNKD